KQSEAEPTLKQIATLQQSNFQKYDTYVGTTAAGAMATNLTGFEDPNATYFTFEILSGNATSMCAKATPTAQGTAAGVVAMYITQSKAGAATDARPTTTACT
ncbi:MAG TPA: hypothetical protein VF710_02450, partial [Longimicrobium sp.]